MACRNIYLVVEMYPAVGCWNVAHFRLMEQGRSRHFQKIHHKTNDGCLLGIWEVLKMKEQFDVTSSWLNCLGHKSPNRLIFHLLAKERNGVVTICHLDYEYPQRRTFNHSWLGLDLLILNFLGNSSYWVPYSFKFFL